MALCGASSYLGSVKAGPPGPHELHQASIPQISQVTVQGARGNTRIRLDIGGVRALKLLHRTQNQSPSLINAQPRPASQALRGRRHIGALRGNARGRMGPKDDLDLRSVLDPLGLGV